VWNSGQGRARALTRICPDELLVDVVVLVVPVCADGC
jgi:hypothetical protein